MKLRSSIAIRARSADACQGRRRTRHQLHRRMAPNKGLKVVARYRTQLLPTNYAAAIPSVSAANQSAARASRGDDERIRHRSVQGRGPRASPLMRGRMGIFASSMRC
jgi:hypothetical protein